MNLKAVLLIINGVGPELPNREALRLAAWVPEVLR